MKESRDTFDTRIENGSTLLMARIVDTAGKWVRPRTVATISYSLFVLDSRRPFKRLPIPGRVGVALAVDAVMFESLQHSAAWTLDVCGYNFFHRIECGQNLFRLSAQPLIEAVYLFTPAHGEGQLIRFQWRHDRDDRR